MKFACDECAAQYMIADEKVGSKGVKVRCKKCSHVIVVRPQVETTDPKLAAPSLNEAEEEDDSPTQMGMPPEAPPAEDPDPFGGGLAATDDGVDATVVLPNPMGMPPQTGESDGAPPVLAQEPPVPVSSSAPAGGSADGLQSVSESPGLDLEQALGAELGAELGEDIAAPPTNGEAAAAAAGAEPKGPDDEIGMAFDSIFGGAGLAPEAGGAPASSDPFSSDVDDAFEAALGSSVAESVGDEHSSTRVFDTNSMQLLASEREIQEDAERGAEPAFETGNGAAPADSGEAEWYVAVQEERVGPLTVAEVQVRWEAGDLGPDSLCWKNGMVDWEPLSTVEGLKDLIAPMPETFAPEPAAFEPEPSAGEEEDGVGDEADGGWKPGAAALLATLAADEIEALENEPVETLAAPTMDPVGLPSSEPSLPLGAPLGGLDLDGLPPPPAAAPEMGFPPGAPLTPAGAFQPEPASRPPPAYGMGAPATGGVPVLGSPTGQVPVMSHPTTGAMHTLPVGPATGAVSTMPPSGGLNLTMGKLAALGGGLLGALTLIIFGGLWIGGVFDKEAAVADVPVPPVADAAAAEKAVAAAPAEPTPAPAAAAPAEAAPEAAAAPAAAVVAAPTPPKPATRTRTRTRTPTRTRTRAPDPPKPDPPKAVTSKGKTGGKGLLDDDDFDDLFDDKPKSGGSSAAATPSRGYIPPAPGAAKNLPKSLGQSDILKVVAQSKGSLKSCAEKQRKASPGEKGRFVMNWRIRPDGRPASVSCKSAGAPVFCKCMKGAIGQMRFPRYGGPPMAPFDFPFSY